MVRRFRLWKIYRELALNCNIKSARSTSCNNTFITIQYHRNGIRRFHIRIVVNLCIIKWACSRWIKRSSSSSTSYLGNDWSKHCIDLIRTTESSYIRIASWNELELQFIKRYICKIESIAGAIYKIEFGLWK
jgi:hypothetical protein